MRPTDIVQAFWKSRGIRWDLEDGRPVYRKHKVPVTIIIIITSYYEIVIVIIIMGIEYWGLKIIIYKHNNSKHQL